MTTRGTLGLLAIAAALGSFAPTHAQVGGVEFRSAVDVVTLNVTVTGPARRFVTDLDQSEFAVFEDGRPQAVTYFQKSGTRLAVALLIDTSASMQMTLPIAQEAATGLVRALAPADVASLVTFDSRVQMPQPLTNDRAALEAAIRKTVAYGATSLYTAVYVALKELNKAIPQQSLTDTPRRAIVILSDGEDTSSLVDYEQVLDLAARSDTAIYAIGLGQETAGSMAISTALRAVPSQAQFVLRRFANQTGGRAIFPASARELKGIYAEIRNELANQYFLAYESNNARRDGRFRQISVRVERPGAVARARPGYYAPSQ